MNLWDDLEEIKTNFVNFKSGKIGIMIEKHISKYNIREMKGKFGNTSYIEIDVKICEKDEESIYEKGLLKIDSKRLRKALVEECDKVKKYPVELEITRDGNGYNTYYHVKKV